MELLGLYDKNGKSLNKSVERGTKPNDGYIMLSIGIIKNNNNKYLIQKTSKTKGSLYSLTGGHVTYGETPLEAMIREVKEELGININKDSINYIALEKHPKGLALVSLFLIKTNANIKDFKLQNEEVFSVDYYSLDEVLNFINNNKFHPTHAYFFKRYSSNEILKIK